MAEQASSSTFDDSDACIYDVFLSFRGDTRKTFTDHLHKALKNGGYRIFRDKDDAESGKILRLELKKAIQQSRSSIIVFSKDFASSTWCLNEVVMILNHMKQTTGHFVRPIFYDVDPSEVREQTENFATSFAKYQELIEKESDPRKKKELMDKVNEWRKALEEVADLRAKVLKKEADG